MIKHSERFAGVDSRLRKVIERAAMKADFDVTVSEGVRTPERQRQLYAEGKSKTMNSKHLTGSNGLGAAVDIYPLLPNGQLNWNGFDQLVKLVKASAAELDEEIVCGYDWGWDKPHVELKNR